MGTDAKAATLDILEALLCAPPPQAPADVEAFPNQRALARLVRRVAPPASPVSSPVSPPAKPRPAARPLRFEAVAPAPTGPKRRSGKRKTTQYFAETTAARLDAAKASLAGTAKGRVTKSGIVEAALALALDAFESGGEKSPLAKRLTRSGKAGRAQS